MALPKTRQLASILKSTHLETDTSHSVIHFTESRIDDVVAEIDAFDPNMGDTVYGI